MPFHNPIRDVALPPFSGLLGRYPALQSHRERRSTAGEVLARPRVPHPARVTRMAVGYNLARVTAFVAVILVQWMVKASREMHNEFQRFCPGCKECAGSRSVPKNCSVLAITQLPCGQFRAMSILGSASGQPK